MNVLKKAWTGGSRPTKKDKKTPAFRALRHELFREQVADCGGLGLWVCAGTSVLERARIFWGRANYDAHATLRG